jgi:hypothetical protein
MGLIIALGAIGIVNGLWSKNLLILGTVETGDLNADWASVEVSDNGLDPCTPGVNPNDCDYPAKDVGSCEAVLGAPPGPLEEFGDQVLTVTITNAYPSYECTVTAVIANTGTIPFNIISVSQADLSGNEEGIELIGGPDGASCVLPDFPAQVDPGDTVEGEVSCTIHVLQTAAQSGDPDGLTQTYYFVLNACVAQWNEAATAEECKTSEQHEGPPEMTPSAPTRD